MEEAWFTLTLSHDIGNVNGKRPTEMTLYNTFTPIPNKESTE